MLEFQMAQRVRPYGLLLALLIGALALSGCVTVDVESEFNEDGSATHVMELTLDTEDLQQLGELAGEEGNITESFTEGFDELQEQGEREGFQVEQINEDGLVGTRITKAVEDNSDLGEVLNTIINSNAETTEVANAFSGSFTEDDGTYRLELTVDGSQLSEGAGGELGGEGATPEEFEMFGLDSILEMTYIAHLPGDIDEDETNGRVGDDGRVEWEIPLDGSETFIAVSKTGGDDSNLALLLIGGGLIAALLLVGIGVIILMMTRRGPDPEPAPAGGAIVPPDTDLPGYPPTTQPSGTGPSLHDQPTREINPSAETRPGNSPNQGDR